MGFPYCTSPPQKKTKHEVLHGLLVLNSITYEDAHFLPAFHAHKIMSVSQNRLKNNLKTGYDSFIADKSTAGNMLW